MERLKVQAPELAGHAVNGQNKLYNYYVFNLQGNVKNKHVGLTLAKEKTFVLKRAEP